MAAVIPGQLGMSTPLGELLGKSDAEMNAEFADYAALGVSWLRTNFWWGHIQPNGNGSYNWAEHDRVVATANKYGINVVGGLGDTPPGWVSNSGGMHSDANIQAFGTFAKAAAEHFKGKVQHWEIWNEPNLAGPWRATPNAIDYTKALKAAYTAIKSVDHGSVVITGGLSPAPERSSRGCP